MNIIKINQNIRNTVNDKKNKDNTKINFSKATFDNLPLPPQGMKKKYYKDEKVKGLWLYVTESGTKCFQVRKRVSGLLRTRVIGEYPYISVPNARTKAFEIISDWVNIDAGIKAAPVVKQEEMSELTLFQVLELYTEKHIERNADEKNVKKIQRSKSIYEHNIKKHYSKLANVGIDKITNLDLTELHQTIAKHHGKHQGNRAIQYIRAAINKCEEWGQLKNVYFKNPASRIKLYHEESRARYIEPEELPRFFKALSVEENCTMKHFVFMALLTGQRREKILSMRWKDLDLNKRIWQIPQNIEVTNKNAPKTLPLIDEAVRVLNNRKKLQVVNDILTEYVFHSQNSHSGHIQEPKKALRRILELASMEHIRTHDLRRTFGTSAYNAGVSKDNISQILGHKSEEVSKPKSVSWIYIKVELDTMKLSIQKAFEYMVKKLKIIQKEVSKTFNQ